MSMNKAEQGHFKKAGVSPKKYVREFKFENAEEYSLGAEIKADMSHSDFCRQNCFLHFSSLSAPEGIVYIADHAAIVALQPPRRRDCVLTSST